MQIFTRALLRAISVVSLLLVGFIVGWTSASALGASLPLPDPVARALGVGGGGALAPAEVREQFGLFWEVWDLVGQEYYARASLDHTKMIQGAVKGMLASLNDPYTVYQEPDLAAQTQDHLQGKLGGIGTYLRITDGRAFLYKPFRGGPAYEAGLRQDDEILAIDGAEVAQLIAGLDGNAAAVAVTAKLRGPEGSPVALMVRIAADGSARELTLSRRDIVVPSVEAQRLAGGVLYLRIAEFKATTTAEFDQALADQLREPPRAIILDLRNNPGGLLSSSQEILGRFYTGVALYEEDGAGALTELPTIAGGTPVPSVPLVVLVNGGSASSSEIVAGALSERRPNTRILGEKTFGKGSVQTIRSLRDGGNLRVTFAHWLTPEKRAIQDVGITPQQVVVFADDPGSLAPCVGDRLPAAGQQQCGDTQLAAAIQQLQPAE